MSHLTVIAALSVGLSLSTLATAQSAGTWTVRAGLTSIKPDVSSGNLSSPSLQHTTIGVGSDTQASLGVNYTLTDHWAIDVPVAPPFKHKLYGDGAIAGVGQIGSVRALPASVFLQYRFEESNSTWRPYVGLGVSYAMFSDPRGSAALTGITNPGGAATSLKVDNAWGITPQLGFVYKVNDRYFIDASYSKAMLKTKATLSTGQSIDVKLDPAVLSIGIGMTF